MVIAVASINSASIILGIANCRMFRCGTYFPFQQPGLLLSAQNIFSVDVVPPFFVIIG
jgi:hypothetical protein